MVDRGWEWFLACQVLLLCCCEADVGRVGEQQVGTLYLLRLIEHMCVFEIYVFLDSRFISMSLL